MNLFSFFRRERFEANIERAARRTGGVLQSRYGLWGLAVISFTEAALVIPLITDPFLVVYMLANRTMPMRAVFVTACASVLGGIAAYAMAYAFFDLIAAQFLTGVAGEEFQQVAGGFQNNTFVLTFIGAFTPIPYTIIALAVGFVKGSFLAFVLASIVGRGGRYAIVGYFVHRFGPGALEFARPRIAVITWTALGLSVAYLLFHFFT